MALRSHLSSKSRPNRIFRFKIFPLAFFARAMVFRALASRSANTFSIFRSSKGHGHFKSREFESEHGRVFVEKSLNEFLSLGRPAWRKAREVIQELLAADNPTLRDDAHLREHVFHKQKDVVMELPAHIGDYTDFYSSYHHAHNVGTMLRGPENALMPNWKWLPVAYHGRASSIVPAEPTCGVRAARQSRRMRPRRLRAESKRSITNWRWRFSSGRQTR